MDKKQVSRDEIVAEYLTGTISYRALGAKYNISYRTICGWVLKYQGRRSRWKKALSKKFEEVAKKDRQEFPNEIQNLKEALRKKQLKNKLLEEMLKLSEEHTGINLRKKFGSRQQ